MSKNLYFYATRNDLLTVMRKVESEVAIKYVRFGHTASVPPESFSSAAQIPNLGTASHPSAGAGEKFLVCNAETIIRPRQLKILTADDVKRFDANDEASPMQLVGVKRYAIDQLENPDTIAFNGGGMWEGHILLHGAFGTASESKVSLSLMRRFQTALRKTFVKVRAFYVGPEALTFLKSGGRLTMAVQSPPEYDLRI